MQAALSHEGEEGAALAAAIIESARDIGAQVAATTHYAELKVYAMTTPGLFQLLQLGQGQVAGRPGLLNNRPCLGVGLLYNFRPLRLQLLPVLPGLLRTLLHVQLAPELEPPPPTRPAEKGDTVELLSMGTKATVLSVNKDGTLQLQAGILKISAKQEEVRVVEGETQAQRDVRRIIAKAEHTLRTAGLRLR